ncbi:hypothetical protein [Nocardia sp. No.11]|uniref:alpha/beta fold hydrolase n=1 Tax=Nocardia sp. No.11 TaxID=3128861 RepID=UPI00319E7DA4
MVDLGHSLPISADQLDQAAAAHRLTMPTLAIGAHPVGDALERQLRPITDDLVGQVIPDCGHLIPLDRPHELLDLMMPFLIAERPAVDIPKQYTPYTQEAG